MLELAYNEVSLNEQQLKFHHIFKEASRMAFADLDYTASPVPFVVDKPMEHSENSVTSYMEE